MRIAFFHNWSDLALPLVHGLIRMGRDDLFIVGSAIPSIQRDRELIRIAKRHKIPLQCPQDLLEPGFLKRLQDFSPDLLIVATFPKKIPNPLLELPRLAAINLHAAYLPKYRGAAPEFWALYHGERETGLTLHKMTEEFDAGVILSQVKVPILPTDTLLSLTDRMIQPAWDLLVELLERYRSGENPKGVPQDPALVSQAPSVRRQHLQFQWAQPAEAIERLVRAAYPVYEVKTRFRSLELTLVEAAVGPTLSPPLQPGELRRLPGGRRLVVGTGQGTLELYQLQVTYGPRVDADRFCDLYGVDSGERLVTE